MAWHLENLERLAGAGVTSVTTERRGDLTIVRLVNDLISLEVLPELGARVWTLLDRRRDEQWIWHNKTLQPQPFSPDRTYDEQWIGGWEELFPNDAPGMFEGRCLPDHGEWWSARWTWEITNAGPAVVQVKLAHDDLTIPTSCEKWITVDDGSAAVRIDYRISNRSTDVLHFLLKQHLAVAVAPGDRIDLPGGLVHQVDPAFSTLLNEGGPSRWSSAGLDVCPAASAGHREFVYVSDSPEGWCAVHRPASGASIRLNFSRQTFPYTWMFMDFGGWKGHYVVVLEPSTNMPKDLTEALRLGKCATLDRMASLQCSISVELN